MADKLSRVQQFAAKGSNIDVKQTATNMSINATLSFDEQIGGNGVFYPKQVLTDSIQLNFPIPSLEELESVAAANPAFAPLYKAVLAKVKARYDAPTTL